MGANDPCKGCVCASCKISGKQGDLYSCKQRRCLECDDVGILIKLGYCAEAQPLEEKEGFTWK